MNAASSAAGENGLKRLQSSFSKKETKADHDCNLALKIHAFSILSKMHVDKLTILNKSLGFATIKPKPIIIITKTKFAKLKAP